MSLLELLLICTVYAYKHTNIMLLLLVSFQTAKVYCIIFFQKARAVIESVGDAMYNDILYCTV